MSIHATPAGRAPSVATVRRATAVINPSFGVVRAEGKRMPISTLSRISGRSAVKRPNVTWSRIVCRMRSMRLIAIVLSWACLALGADQDSAVNGMWHAQMD